MSRQLEQTLAWVEKTMNGKILCSVEQLRWRPQYFIDIATPKGVEKVVLRGFRDYGLLDPDEAGSRKRLLREAKVLEALANTDVPVPRVYGYNEAGGWILMECLPGSDKLTAVTDRQVQAKIFREYLESMAKLHALDVNTPGLPADLDKPQSDEDCIRQAYRHRLKAFESQSGGPDPFWTYALGWLERSRPDYVDHFSLCTGDMGVDQFFFDEGRFTAMFDLENVYISDPLRDIGMMRYRDMLYPLPDMAGHIRYFGEISGRCVTDQSLHFWTILGMLGASPSWRAIFEKPDAKMPREMSLMLAMTPIRRRGCAEAFHHLSGWPLPPRPERPHAVVNRHSKFACFVRDQLDEYYLPRIKDAGDSDYYTMQLTHAHAEMAVLASTIGPAIAQLNIEDLGELLGCRPESELSGLAELEERVRQNPDKDLELFMSAMYRIECRNEYLYEPLIKATGFAFGSPLQPIT